MTLGNTALSNRLSCNGVVCLSTTRGDGGPFTLGTTALSNGLSCNGVACLSTTGGGQLPLGTSALSDRL